MTRARDAAVKNGNNSSSPRVTVAVANLALSKKNGMTVRVRREGAGFGKQNNEDLGVYNGTVKGPPFGRLCRCPHQHTLDVVLRLEHGCLWNSG
jgi:hypothetical protein